MTTRETNVEIFLQSHQIIYNLYEHPAVYTCEEAEKYCGDIPGLACKNLFLRDKKKKNIFYSFCPPKNEVT